MSNFSLVEVANSKPLKVNTGAATSPFYFGAVKNLYPNVPSNSSNPNYLGKKLRHKQFGGGCVGKNNVGYFITRVSNGHGAKGGNLYWSKTFDEGLTWTPLQLFEYDKCTDATTEDLRDCNIYYDELIEKYFLIYVHCYNIDEDYVNCDTRFKVLISDDEPFEGTWYDISPGVIPLDGQTSPDYNYMQNFEVFHRVGSKLLLPVYSWGAYVDRPIYGAGLLSLNFNDGLPLSTAISSMSWGTVFEGAKDFDNETTFYTSYKEDGAIRLNLLSRGGNDLGYLRYSDDGGTTWSEKASIGFDIAGGPRVFEINGGYMLVAREQKISGIRTIFAIFSSDGETWENRTKVDDAGTAYASLLKFESGKTLLLYGLEYSHLGIQVSRQVFNLPI